ncbi:MAG TPA: hypothetical protein VNZ45_15340 [Bacteroidia bacterium]|jgi:hypothetical protein|nr:hypothetical protein [Bacteroidia bacterium]
MKISRVLLIVIASFIMGGTTTMYAQNVGINTTGATPGINSILDLNTGNQYKLGLTIPHVELGVSLAAFSPPIANAPTINDTGMVVYNMGGPQPVGVYYWSGTTWISVSANAANSWLLTGNTGTTQGTNYIGTNDSMAFEIKVNGKQRMLFNINQSCISAGLGDLAKVSTGHNNDAWGNYSLANNTTGNYNSAVGGHTLFNNVSGWGDNAHGHEALYSNTTGHSNSAVGDSALFKNTVGNNNTAVGILASFSNVSASSTTAFGDYAGYNNLQSRCTFIGDSAGYSNTTGKTEALGYFALGSNTTGSLNTAVGTQALRSNITASGSTAVGHYAGYNSNADYVVFVGDSAGFSNTSGIRNTSIGYQSGALTTTGNSNTAIGYTSLYHNIIGGQNTAIGYQALYSGTGYFGTATGFSAMTSTTTGLYNTANGWSALYMNQTGSSNTAIGSSAGYNYTAGQGVFIGDSAFYNSTTGTGNTGVGYAVGLATVGGLDNTATGYEALYKNVAGSYNTAIGYEALYTNTGLNNTAIGYNALASNTIGSQNTATGVNALGFTTYGGGNTADGYRALVSNTTSSGNIAIGDSAIYSQSYGTTFNSGNVAVGNSALYANNPVSTITGNLNTAVGQYSMRYNSTGNNNTAEGYSALYGTTTGTNNVGIGYDALSANTAGGYNTAIGAGANVSFNGFTNATAIGAGATATASNSMVFGNSAVTQFEFKGAFMPYYAAVYNAGSLGQALVSQGAGISPQWGAISVSGGGTGSATYNPNALIFEGPTNTSPLTSSVNMTYNSSHNTLVLGSGTVQSQSSANLFGNINSYYQLLLQNTNSGANASTDLVVQDDQDSTHYGDLGINSSTYSQAGYSVQSPGDVYFYSNKSNIDIGTVNAASNGIDSIKFTCGGLNKSNLTEVMSPAGITTQVHFAADSLVIPVHTGAYTPKYLGEKWIYQHAGDTTECTSISLIAGRKVDSVSLGSSIGWTSTLTGFSGVPTQASKYTLSHKICQVDVNVSGSSNATTFTFTLPFIPKNSDVQIFGQYTNGSFAGYAGIISYTAGSNLASCAPNTGNLNGWTIFGTKALNGLVLSYEVQ